MKSMSISAQLRMNVNQSNLDPLWRKNVLSKQSLRKILTWPQAVKEYVRSGIFDLQAATWAVENNEPQFFWQLLNEKNISMHMDKIAQQMEIAWRDLSIPLAPAIEFTPIERIDTFNASKYILFLKMPGLNITKLQLDISNEADYDSMALFRAIDTLEHPPELQVKVDGRSEGQLDLTICHAFASSKICLSTPNIRNWTFAKALSDMQNGDRDQEYKQASKLIEALPLAPIPGSDTHIEELANLARNCENEILLLAIHTLAPNHKINIKEIPPSVLHYPILESSKIPCAFQLDLTSNDFDKFALTLQIFGGLGIFTEMTLTIVESISQESAGRFIHNLAQLTSIEHLSLTINPGVSVAVPDLEVGARSGQIKSLIFDFGQNEDANSIRFLRILNRAFMPSTLKIRVGTPGAAAHIVTTMPEQQADRMRQLDITCTSHSISEGADLVAALEELLQKLHHRANILVRTQAPLLNAQEKAKLRRVAHDHQPLGNILIEHFSLSGSDWQSDLRIEPQIKEVASAFFSHLKLPDGTALPSQIGEHAVNIGAISLDDVPALALLSASMGNAWGQASRNHAARVITFELNSDLLDASSLRARLTPSGKLDMDLVAEVRHILDQQRAQNDGHPDKYKASVALLNTVAKPDGS